ncbi:MAG: imidazolonepropionase [Planctomycetes bacterium]|nr:imidazolonepropionase [Planctomycetota bacterium]
MLVLENLHRIVTCAPPGVSGPLLGERMGDLAPVDGDLSVAVREGRVAFVGARANLPAEFKSAPRHDCRGLLLTPALIDCHTHPAFVRSRADEFELRLAGASYEQIAAQGGGILSSMKAVRESSDAELLNATRRNLQRLRDHGVAVAEGKSGYGLNLEHELRQLRAIRDAGQSLDMHTIRTCLAAHSFPPEFRGDDARREAYVAEVCNNILPAAAQGGLAQRADVFCEQGVFTVPQATAVAHAARRHGLRVTVHAEQLCAFGGAAMAAGVGADSADHLEFADAATMAAMQAAGTSAVLLPGSTYHLRMNQWADGRAMINAGLCVALSTDFNPGSSPIPNPCFIMNLAVMRCGLTPAQALCAFTRNAAHALRLDTAQWGLIAVGARAAFALWDVAHERELAYYAGANLCAGVIKCQGWRS